MCVGAVVIGGITRLTESGLSMTKWHPIHGMRPPMTQEEWQEEFEAYKQFPEYKHVHADMDVEGFKSIFFWEYFHRMWGRAIGGVYLVPYMYFLARGHLKAAGLTRSATGLLGVLGAQGLYGWYMVKSGLDRQHLESRLDSKIARVSQYRLAGHLSLALTLFAGTLNNALKCLWNPGQLAMTSDGALLEKALKLKRMAPGMTIALVALSIVSGAFVAGLDAGMAYNNWPHMASDRVIPSDAFNMSPLWRDLLENPTTVQLEHRIITHFAFFSLMAVCLVGYRARAILPTSTKYALAALFGASWLQVTLGITTLLHHCPIALAASHQSGSVILLASSIALCHSLLRFTPNDPRVATIMKQIAKKSR